MVSGRDRPGHSLPELIVAVTFLGASLGAIGATAALATGWTRGAVMRQDAVREASAVLDSLMAAPVVADGERRAGAVAVWWTARGTGPVLELEVTALGPDGRELVRLGGPWRPSAPLLPWPTGLVP